MKIVRLEGEIDFEGFRRAARAAAARGLGADAIRFVTETGEEENDLFAEQKAPEPSTTDTPLRVPPRFLDLADLVCRHKEPTRYDLLMPPFSGFGRRRASWRSPATHWGGDLRTRSARCGAIVTR